MEHSKAVKQISAQKQLIGEPPPHLREKHSQAVNEMLAEKYLLGELPPDVRDAFEEHFFECPECAFDIRAGAAFVDEAKIQLPHLRGLESAAPEPSQSTGLAAPAPKKKSWTDWWRPLLATPAFAAPVFASLLAVIAYQNFVTYPALRVASIEPRLLPSDAVHVDTRPGERLVLQADRKLGVLLQIDVPEGLPYAAYVFDLYDPQGKLAWTHEEAAATGTNGGLSGLSGLIGQTLTLTIPGVALQQGSYALVITGVTAQGQRIEYVRKVFDMQIKP